jgi:hypothetical protein
MSDEPERIPFVPTTPRPAGTCDFEPGTLVSGFRPDEGVDWSGLRVGGRVVLVDYDGVSQWQITEVTGPGKFQVEPVN